ncbi:MAG: T9SS type A sorting domain-containing protein [Bacteroidota bacterium]
MKLPLPLIPPNTFRWALLLLVFATPLNSLIAQHAYCDVRTTPEWFQLEEESRDALARYAYEFDSRMVDTIYFMAHIVTRSDGTGGLTLAQLDVILNDMNLYYSGMNVYWKLCNPEFLPSDDLYTFNPTRANENFLIGNFNRPGTFNIYFVGSMPGLCGYTYLPGGPDIMMMSIQTGGCGPLAGTVAHEVGHYLGLYHTFGKGNSPDFQERVDGSNCATAGDDLCDTPADPGDLRQGLVNGACEYIGNITDSNGDLYAPDPSNIMAYSPGDCQDKFSPGQHNRMRFFLERSPRSSLLGQDGSCGEDISECLTVTSNIDLGLGSLRNAINCANNFPGPDTIRFNLLSSTIELASSLPPLTDDGTVIEGISIPTGRAVVLDARDIEGATSLFRIQGDNIKIKDLEIERYLRSGSRTVAAGAVELNTGASNFLLENVLIERSVAAIYANGGHGTIRNCNFYENRFGVKFGDNNPQGIDLEATSMLCSDDGGFGYQNGDRNSVQNYPDAPFITEISTQGLSGSAIAGARVEVFENLDGDCLGAPCQGQYLGTAVADAGGFWTVPIEGKVLSSYTAIATISSGGTRHSSEFANCKGILDALDEQVDYWVYPIPVTGDNLILELKGEREVINLSFFNMTGQIVYREDIEMDSEYIRQEIPIGSRLAAGVYVMKMIKGETTYTQKIVIQ